MTGTAVAHKSGGDNRRRGARAEGVHRGRAVEGQRANRERRAHDAIVVGNDRVDVVRRSHCINRAAAGNSALGKGHSGRDCHATTLRKFRGAAVNGDVTAGVDVTSARKG